jgi:hypothetical protein
MSPKSTRNGDPRVGKPVDLAEFATVRWWTGTEKQDLHAHDLQPGPDGAWQPARDPETGQWHIGLEWEDARDVRSVIVRFAGAPPPDLKVQYWRKVWPTVAPERRAGARRGWIGRDDPWHGEWVTVRGETNSKTNWWRITCDPIDLPELGGRSGVERLEEAENYLAIFRRALKIRVVCRGEAQPVITGLEAYGAAVWEERQINVHFQASGDWSGRAEACNGYILGTEPIGFAPGDGVAADGSWSCHSLGTGQGVRLTVLYTAGDQGVGSRPWPVAADRTIVTVRARARSFSFQTADLDRGPVYIPDYGIYVTWANAPVEFAAYQAALASKPKPIYDRVPDEPEQSLARAMAEIPPLDPTIQDTSMGLGRYLPISADAGRQEWAVRWSGELLSYKGSLKLKGRDAARLLWPGAYYRIRFGTGDPPDFRERRGATEQSLLENWLPVVISRWQDREIAYEETAYAALLDGPMTPPEARRGDEDTVAMLRFSIRNTTHGRKHARLWIVIAPQEQVELRDGLVVALGRVVPAEPVARQWRVDPYEREVLRFALHNGGQGTFSAVGYGDQAAGSQGILTAIAYDVDLEGGASHAITMAAPFVSFTAAEDWARVKALGWKADDVVAYWKSVVESAGQLELPDTILNQFHKSVQTHVAISADKDPVSGLIAVPAATYDYGVCANEACWQISMFDQAGHHRRVETYLETFLATQGMSQLDGNFSSSEGVMQGLDFDAGVPLRSGFAYNLDPGYIMECLVDHYRLTGDRAWLERVAPKLVAACDFIIRERQRTKTYSSLLAAGGKQEGNPAPEWGLLPAGHLEDNPEWRYWFAVNAHAYNGMQGIAAILGEIGHPEAPRLAQEAAAYREDIRAAARRGMIEAPVVQLLDGTYVPHVPTHAGRRGRELGWFREAAYGAIHLMESNVFEPGEEEMTWLLKDLEDNLFVTREWGRPVDLERFWFSHGGITIQANLMDTAIDYLRRGQVEHGLRALFNNFGASMYADVRCFTEHPVVELGHGVGPNYKSSDEAKALVWLRAFLLHEQGNTLRLAPGAPRAWFASGQAPWGVRGMATHFGPVSYRISPDADGVSVEVEAAFRRPPAELRVHLRRPAGAVLRTVTVNGRPAVFDSATETVRIPEPGGSLRIRAEYTA